ncbi:MAG: zinc ribbon domain-containing protein [Candidatus Heimdallarchaeota archaeon]|nr:MAG: zinc ribbon domain-containing protein [Candidatus Heimdallarchaeota archaeon]
MKQISRANENQGDRKKKKKSFWFEYAEKKGVDPHKSAWREFTDEKRKEEGKITRFCRKCGTLIKTDWKFCEKCGSRIQIGV